jgi:hypothetical protein
MEKLIRIERFQKTGNSTIGRISVNGQFIGYTLELPWKNNANEISCIPTGQYPVAFRNDPGSKYKYRHLHVRNVPGRQWILVHKGNFPKDTLGCILPGLTFSPDYVGESSIAFRKLMNTLEGATSMTLTIVDV